MVLAPLETTALSRLRVIGLLLAALSGPAMGAVHLLVVTGLPGEPLYEEVFEHRALTLIEVARGRLGIADERIRWLAGSMGSGERSADGLATREGVLAELAVLAETSSPGDTVALVLIGHGTAREQQALFNLPGPDLAPLDLDRALRALDGRRLAVIHTAAGSAPFLVALSAPGRVLISATGSAAEDRYTRFADPFIEALAGSAADTDKDGRVSLLEAFRYARREVRRLYESEHRLQTEHALLDDDGDGRGSEEPGSDGADGALARGFHLAARGRQPLSDDPRVIGLEAEARDLVADISALKRTRVGLSDEIYDQRLEELLLGLARNRRALREGRQP